MFDPATLAELRARRKDWERRVAKEGKERAGPFMTVSSRPVRRLYDPTDLADDGFDYGGDLGNPGDYPYTRGIHAVGYRGKPWTIRMFSGFGSVVNAIRNPAFATSRRTRKLWPP